MVNVSQDIIKSFNEGNKQTALIEVTAGRKTFTITDADIIQGGLKIDRYCVTNSKIEVGSAVASELPPCLLKEGSVARRFISSCCLIHFVARRPFPD